MKRINIVAWHNGGGLSRDVDILVKALPEDRFEVTLNGFPISQAKVRRQRIVHRTANFCHLLLHRRQLAAAPYDINLFLEDITPGFFKYARTNAFIPNPEWFKKYQHRYLKSIDIVLCKSRSAQQTFDSLGSHTRFISFTSEDRLDTADTAEKSPDHLHLAGRSWQKGTKSLTDLWLKHPEWPGLTVVQSAKTYSQTRVEPIDAPNINHILDRLDDAHLRELQNTHAIHLCPSEAEGFGHCIAEAMSCRALILTTNGPPMNELITAERGILVNYDKTRKQRSGENYFVDLMDLEQSISKIIEMDQQSILQLGLNGRAWFEENDQYFRTELVSALEKLLSAD
jgi:glycosyltransferase involved in cell wall biosynthesis